MQEIASQQLLSRGDQFRLDVLATLEPADPAAMSLLDAACATLDELQMLEESVRVEGVLIDGARGQRVANPALSAITRHRALLARLLADLFPETRETQSQAAARAGRARWGK